MKKFKLFFRMKYEMFLMRVFDYIYNRLLSNRLSWYPDYIINGEDRDKYLDKWIEAESRASDYKIQLLDKDEYIFYLEQRLDLYEFDFEEEAES